MDSFTKVDRTEFTEDELEVMKKVVKWIHSSSDDKSDKWLSECLLPELEYDDKIKLKNLKEFNSWVLHYEKANQGEEKRLRDVGRHVNLLIRAAE